MAFYSLQALFAQMGVGHREGAVMLGMSGQARSQLLERGLTERQADRYAVRAGYHPFEVWPVMRDLTLAAFASPVENLWTDPDTGLTYEIDGKKRQRSAVEEITVSAPPSPHVSPGCTPSPPQGASGEVAA